MRKTVVTELTDKRLKLHLILAHVVFYFGPCLYLMADDNMKEEGIWFALGFMGVGFLYYAITKVRIWWNNG